MKLGYVYWIHKKEHTDIFNEGYVGITNNIEKRWKTYKSLNSGLCHHIKNAILKHGADNLIWEVVFTGDYDLCQKEELKYRPDFNIGWNILKGGSTSSAFAGRKLSQEHKNNLSKALKGKKNPISIANLKPSGNIKAVKCVETDKTYSSAKIAGEETGINHSNIVQVCKHKRKSAGGFTWEYVNS